MSNTTEEQVKTTNWTEHLPALEKAMDSRKKVLEALDKVNAEISRIAFCITRDKDAKS